MSRVISHEVFLVDHHNHRCLGALWVGPKALLANLPGGSRSQEGRLPVIRRGAPWTYQGERVHVDDWAGIPHRLRPCGRLAGMIQEVLDEVVPWEGMMRIVHEHELARGGITPAVMSVEPGEPILWGVRKGTRAHNGGRFLSPFTTKSFEPVRLITVELVGTVVHPRMTRAYGGNYAPSLPGSRNVGSKSAVKMTPEERRQFWRTHARPLLDLELGTETDEPPTWYTEDATDHGDADRDRGVSDDGHTST
jgi:hypothetical protein